MASSASPKKERGAGGGGADEKFSDNVQKFKDLTQKPIEQQSELFMKSFIFDLGDDWKMINKLETSYRKRLVDAAENQPDLNPVMAADFLQKNGKERTAQQRKEEVADVDLDHNGRIAFIEYLLLHYKSMILTAYYKRTGESCPYDLSHDGVGLKDVGKYLLDELFTMPMGLDPELERAIEEFTKAKKAREDKLKDLRTKSDAGGVKGLAASNEIKQMESADNTQMNKLEITLEAAKKRCARDSGEVALKSKQAKEASEAKSKQDTARANLKSKAAMWDHK